MVRALVVVLWLLLPLTARAGLTDCPRAEASAIARRLQLPNPTWLEADAGVILRFDDATGPLAAVWLATVGSAANAQQVSSSVLRHDAEPKWHARLKRLVDELRPALAPGDCLGPPATVAEASALADQLTRLMPHPVAGGVPATSWVALATATTLLLYLGLLAAGVLREGRERPRRVVALLALAIAAAALRWLVAPRLTMVAAQADLGSLDQALAWLDGAWSWRPGDLPPLMGTALAALFELFGPSLDLAFAINLTFGSLLPVAAASLAARLEPSGRATWPAGAVAAVLPLAIWYSNGVCLETPAALFATASLAHTLGWAKTRRTTSLLAGAVAAVLFVLCRPEGFVQAAVLVTGLAAVVARAGLFATPRPALAGALALLTAAALAAPYLAAVVPYYVNTLSARPRQGSPVVLLLALGLAVAALLWPRLQRLAARANPRLVHGAVWAVALCAGVLLWHRASYDPLAEHDPSRPLVPVQWWLGTLRSVFDSPRVGTQILGLDERWFPGLFVVVGLLAALPSRSPSPDRLAGLGRLVALCFVGVVVVVAFSFSVSGEVLLQGLRYQVPALGMAAALVGVGFARLGELLDRLPLRRSLVSATLLAVAALPALTHLDVTTNVWHDSQREFVFVRDAVARLPARATLLVADHEFVTEGAGDHPPRFDAIYRTHPFAHALARLAGRHVDVHGLSTWLAGGRAPGAPVYFLRELNCYRTLAASGEEDLCQRVREVATGAPLAWVEFPHRLYGGMSAHTLRPNQPAVFRLELVPLSAAELEQLRSSLQ